MVVSTIPKMTDVENVKKLNKRRLSAMGKIFDGITVNQKHITRRVPKKDGTFTAECDCGWLLNDIYAGWLASDLCQNHYLENLGYNSDDYVDHACRCRSKVKW